MNTFHTHNSPHLDTAMRPARWWKAPVIALVCITVIAAALMLALRPLLPELPNQVAQHWGEGTHPDGFTAKENLPRDAVFILLITSLPIVLISAALRAFLSYPPVRILMAMAVGTALGVALMFYALAWTQHGLTDASRLEMPGWTVAVLLAALPVGAVAAWPLLPADPKAPAPTTQPQRDIPLAAGERAVWTQKLPIPGWFTAVMTTAVFVTSAALVPVILQNPWLVFIPLLIAALTLSLLHLRVTVDSGGVAWRSGLPFIGGRSTYDQIERADVEDIRPMEYGGWGIRYTGASFGLITRSGPGLVVRRASGKSNVIATVDDAQTAASLINEYVAQRNSS